MAQLTVTQGEGRDTAKANGRAEYVYAAVIAVGVAEHAFDRANIEY